MRTSVLTTVLAVALVAGTGCTGPDTLTDTNTDHFSLLARGANVIPAAADTSATITAIVRGGNAGAITVNYTIGSLPAAVDSIFLYTMAASAANYTVSATTGATTFVAPSARVCGTAHTGPGGTDSTGVAGTAPGKVTSAASPACAAGADLLIAPTTILSNITTTTNTAASLTTSMRAYGQQLVVFTGGANNKRGRVRGTVYLDP